jgi:PAS domain S-box-containing protein
MKKNPQSTIKKKNKKKINNIEKYTIIACLFLSLNTIIEIVFGQGNLLSIVPHSGTMKLNTALIFLFFGICLILSKKKNNISKYSYLFLAILPIIIGIYTLLEFFGISNLQIANFFVIEDLTKVNNVRISPATAICAIIIGLGFIAIKWNKAFFSNFIKIALALVIIISMISILCFILIIPFSKSYYGFGDMGIQTSLLFFSIALVLIFKNKKSVLHHILNEKLKGSEVFRKILPLIIIFPIVLSNIILLGIDQDWINLDFAIVTYTVIFIPISIMYISRISLELNKTDLIRKKLEKYLINDNLNLNQFNKALNVIAVVAITDQNGIIKYVNESFCKIYKYSKKELIGKTHKVVNSGYHSQEFFTNMWNVIKGGNIWVGEVKNKAKDGSFYWSDTTIIPFKDENGKITGYISIRQIINKVTKDLETVNK